MMNYHPQDIPVSQSRLFLKLWQKEKKKPLREKEPDRNRERFPKQASPELHRRLLWFSTLNSEDIFSHPRESIVLFVLLLASPEAGRNKENKIDRLRAADSCNDLFSIQHVAVLFHNE